MRRVFENVRCCSGIFERPESAETAIHLHIMVFGGETEEHGLLDGELWCSRERKEAKDIVCLFQACSERLSHATIILCVVDFRERETTENTWVPVVIVFGSHFMTEF